MGGYINTQHSHSKSRAEMIIVSFILFLYFANCMGGSKPSTEVL